MAWSLKRTKQCAKCPWKKSTNPREIPRGYSEEKHRALEGTIAKSPEQSLAAGELRVMACHEEHEAHCIGWMHHQLGVGNNVSLRLLASSCENIKDMEVFGEQHEAFEDTLPKG